MAGLAPKMSVKAVSLAPPGGPFGGRGKPRPGWLLKSAMCASRSAVCLRRAGASAGRGDVLCRAFCASFAV